MEFNTGGFDPPNVCISLSALPVTIPYTVIYSKLDIVYMKNQIINLFDLWNNRDRKSLDPNPFCKLKFSSYFSYPLSDWLYYICAALANRRLQPLGHPSC